MKVNITTSHNEDEFRSGYTIVVESNEGIRGIIFLDGESEDANLKRDFAGVYRIPILLQQAYNAGKHGEEFELETNEVDWEEFQGE